MLRSLASMLAVVLVGCFSEADRVETTADSAADTTAASGSTTGGTADGSSGPAPAGEPYERCVVDTDCPAEGSQCLFETCFPPCMVGVPCPPTPPGAPPAECTLQRCRMACNVDAPMCPPETTCTGVPLGPGDALSSCVYGPP